MLPLKKIARQAALDAWYAWKERAADPDDKMTNAMAEKGSSRCRKS